MAGDFRGNFINGRNTNRDDEGYAALWLETNPEDTVIMRDGSTRMPGGDTVAGLGDMTTDPSKTSTSI